MCMSLDSINFIKVGKFKHESVSLLDFHSCYPIRDVLCCVVLRLREARVSRRCTLCPRPGE